MDAIYRESALTVGEKLHIVERRKFDNDPRRHFVGEVQFVSEHHLRVEGNQYVFNPSTGLFERIEPRRVRVFAIDNQIGLTILPPDFDLATIAYKRVRNELQFCDGSGFMMELGDFGTHG